jgi:hypothetical protein
VLKDQYGGNSGREFRKTKGNMCNLANICAPDGNYLSTLNTMTDCKLYRIRKRKNPIFPNVDISLVILNDLMKRNARFQSLCYQRSFLYFARYLEAKDPKYTKIFKNIDDSVLNMVGDSSSFHKLKRREKIVLDKGAFLISGSISFKLVDEVRKVSLSRTSYSKFGLIPPCEYPMKAAKETLLLRFKVEILDYDIEGNILINDDEINKSALS